MPLPSAPSTSATGPVRSSVVERPRCVVGGADDADVALLQLVQRAREVGDHEVRHRVGGAAGDLRDGRVDADRVVLRRDHRVRAGAVGHAQAGAEVVRVGDAVEHQQQRRASTASSVSSSEWLLASASTRATTPWWRERAAHLLQALVVAFDQLRAGLAGALDELAHALVAPRRVDMDLEHRARRRLQPHRPHGSRTGPALPSGHRSRRPTRSATQPASSSSRSAPAGAACRSSGSSGRGPPAAAARGAAARRAARGRCASNQWPPPRPTR